MADYISLTELWGEPFDYIIDNCGSSVAQGFVDRVNRIKSGEMTIKLKSPLTESDWDTITDVDFDCTNRIWFHTKHGKQVEFIKVKPVTSNADRIRAMSDEELASLLVHNPWMREESALDWLKREVEL